MSFQFSRQTGPFLAALKISAILLKGVFYVFMGNKSTKLESIFLYLIKIFDFEQFVIKVRFAQVCFSARGKKYIGYQFEHRDSSYI